MRVLPLLSSLVAPPRCALCASPCAPGGAPCDGCRRALERLHPVAGSAPPAVDAAWSAAPYRGVAQAVVRGLKFGRMLSLAHPAAEAIARAPAGLLAGTVVPVPAAPLRGLWRGFDPAEEIACELARITGLPYQPCLRRSQGPRQVGRARADRLAAPPRVRVATSEPPPQAVLVDDVLTTGATLAACAEALRSAGSRRVVAVTFARSLKSLGGTAYWE